MEISPTLIKPTKEMEKELKHFSHEKHPLILTTHGQQEDDQADEESNTICYGCQKPILTDPRYYKCSQCNLFLHKTCAELPRDLVHHPLHPDHPLKLLAQTPYPKDKDRCCLCDACKQVCNSNNFMYHCYSCNFDLHISCAFAEGKLEHPGHKHPLTLLQRLALFACDACGTNEEQQSYICLTCPLWIHRTCALLPSIDHRKGHEHPLSLAYGLPIDYHRYEIPCDICFKEIAIQNWVYYCGPCRYFVHLKCMTRDRIRPRDQPDPKSKEDELDLIQLPTNNFDQVIRHILEKQLGMEILQVPKIIKVSCCQHTLAIVDIQNIIRSKNAEITCHRCIEPIVSLCCQCTQCNYFLHLTCAQLPEELQYPSHQEHKLKLAFVSYVWGTIKCTACNLDCNGYLFMCNPCRFYTFDIKCALLPAKIAHKAHEHSLLNTSCYRWEGNKCNSCGNEVSSFVFACVPCGFYLDYECALLPESVNHRWDKHPLPLSYPPFSDRPGEFYCEICEEEIHPRRWHYHCRECDQSFHPHCMPRLGVSRNCNFGQILEFGRHPHPLMLVREGEYLSSCDSCHEGMYGNRVFKCETCEFYMCLKCVGKIADSGKVAGPAKISE